MDTYWRFHRYHFFWWYGRREIVTWHSIFYRSPSLLRLFRELSTLSWWRGGPVD